MDRITAIDNLQKRETELETRLSVIRETISKKQEELKNAEKAAALYKDVSELLTKTSISIQEKTTQKIAQIVTDMYQYVFLCDDKFVIKVDKKRSTPVASFYIETVKNGKTLLLDPLTADGGGKVDVIALGLRLAALLLYRPQMEKVLLLDEPLRFLSSSRTSQKPYRLRAVEFLKKISKEYGIQLIAVTHDEELLSMADCVYNVSLDSDGYSKIEKLEAQNNGEV